MSIVGRLMIGVVLLAAATAYAAPDSKGPPSEFPGNGNGPPQGWSPRNGHGNQLLPTGGPTLPSPDYAAGPSDVHTVPEPSTLLLSVAALAVLARTIRRRR
jgi:hypothetical protein